MTRPKIKPAKTSLDRLLDLLSLAFLLSSLLLISYHYSSLPDRLAIPFNWPSKDVEGLGAKSLLWANPLICGLLILGIRLLMRYPWILNYPVEISSENAVYHYRMALAMLRMLNLLLASTALILSLFSLNEALQWGWAFIYRLEAFLPALFFLLPLIFVIRMLVRKEQKQA